MKKTHSLTLAALLLLCGCVSDDLPVIPQPQETHELMTHVSMDQAARRLGKLLPAFGSSTRSGAASIGIGVALDRNQQPLTRAEGSEAWFYYFPIEGGERFAIMSAKTELPELLAVGNGTPNWENPDAMVPNPARWSIDATLRTAEARNTEIRDSIADLVGIDKDIAADTIIIVRGESYPMYAAGIEPNNLCPVKWGQDAPYNLMCPDDTYNPGYQAKTCCVATAVAQLFANENLQPASYQDYTYDWNLLSTCVTDADVWANGKAMVQISRLMYELGKPENLDVKYSNKNWISEASPYNISRTLRNFGVYNSGQYISYSTQKVIEELKRGYPVIMGGYGPRGGHAWLVHGMMTMVTPVQVYVGVHSAPEYIFEISYYFDVNWGWSAKGDGYYIETGFNPAQGADFNPNNYPGINFDCDSLNYGKMIQYGVKMTQEK